MKICIVIPTYNERENIIRLIRRIDEVFDKGKVWILIVDDNSPDGTAQVAEEIAKKRGNMFVHKRAGKLGLGSAYREGFKIAFEKLNADVVVEMDADLSHDPYDLPKLIQAIKEGCDACVGSRRVKGGKIVGWGFKRKLISKGASVLANFLLRLNVKDPTSGYRAFKKDALIKAKYWESKAEGYAFQIELLKRLKDAKLRICEVPITFVDREVGESKLGKKEIIKFFLMVLKLMLS